MIGDHKTDLEAARRAGIRSGFIKYGMGEQGGELATRIFESFEDMTLLFCGVTKILGSAGHRPAITDSAAGEGRCISP